MTELKPYLPPEWHPQQAVWVGWPHLYGEWGSDFDGARQEIADFVSELAKSTKVKVACGSREAYGSAWFAFETDIQSGRVTLHTLPAGDIWLRDTGPLFARQAGQLKALIFEFNGWGGKYIMSGDRLTAGGIASAEGAARGAHDFILEGGSLDWDGAGRLLTTRQCLLNPNRNSDWNEAIAEDQLRSALGAEEIIWLDQGLLNDHTDGHIDTLARFIGPGRVVCQTASGLSDPNAASLAAIETCLRQAGLDVVTLPSPGLVADQDGTALPASHMNFLISNGCVLFPVYETVYADQAVQALQAALPDYMVKPLAARHILAGGGAFHCMTQQVPE